MPNFLYPEGYLDLTPEQKAEICNGCGGKGVPDFIPDCLFGADCEEPCNIHDYEYHIGRDKREADRRLLYNMSVACDTNNFPLYVARMRICWEFFKGVTGLGGFFFGKDSHEGS